MARLRKAVAYRKIERPYTRKSKYRELSFVRATPNSKIVRYDMGDSKKNYDYEIYLVSNQDIQIRHNAIEAGRQTTNKYLEKNAGKNIYHFKIKMYPHHILRENPLASGAGADRMSTGMKHSFGKPIGVAAQVSKGKEIASIKVLKQHRDIAKTALKRFTYKLSGKYSVFERKIDNN